MKSVIVEEHLILLQAIWCWLSETKSIINNCSETQEDYSVAQSNDKLMIFTCKII